MRTLYVLQFYRQMYHHLSGLIISFINSYGEDFMRPVATACDFEILVVANNFSLGGISQFL